MLASAQESAGKPQTDLIHPNTRAGLSRAGLSRASFRRKKSRRGTREWVIAGFPRQTLREVDSQGLALCSESKSLEFHHPAVSLGVPRRRGNVPGNAAACDRWLPRVKGAGPFAGAPPGACRTSWWRRGSTIAAIDLARIDSSPKPSHYPQRHSGPVAACWPQDHTREEAGTARRDCLSAT